ncbi:glycosyltransferase [Nocardioidaceae bacterium]|nr:glycosyltransferase [Nocardioidaceae bacterium]
MSERTHHRVPTKVVFLVQNIYGGGGVARTVIGLANALAETHEVTLLGLTSGRLKPQFDLDPRVQVEWIAERRDRGRPGERPKGRRGGKRLVRPAEDPKAPGWQRRLDAQPTGLIDQVDLEPEMSRLTDLLLARRLATLGPCILISTRPTLHRAAARWSPPWVVRIAQEHMNYLTRADNAPVIGAIDAAAERLDAVVTLTTLDEADFVRRWARTKRAGARVVTIPNASPFAIGERAPLEAPVVVTAGRFEARKGFDRVIDGFARAVAERPELADWQLHVYGKGEIEDQLKQRAAATHCADRIVFPGYADDFDAVLKGASIYAMGSHFEGLPMVLLEAQAVGLPIVAYDCPRGPSDLIDDRVSGRLVPDGGTREERGAHRAVYADALAELMTDADLRRRMGAAAQQKAQEYTLDSVVDRWERLFDELSRARTFAGPRRTREVRRNGS